MNLALFLFFISRKEKLDFPGNWSILFL